MNAPAPRAPEKVPLAPRLETTKPRDVPAKEPVAKTNPLLPEVQLAKKAPAEKSEKAPSKKASSSKKASARRLRRARRSSEEEEEEILGLVASDAVGVPRALLPRVRVHHRRRVRDSFRAGGGRRRLDLLHLRECSVQCSPLFCYYPPLVYHRCIHRPPHVNNIYIYVTV